MILENRINKEILKERLRNETFKRRTLSFYRYVSIENPVAFRNDLYFKWFDLNCFGRIYVAHEGINAQMSVPDHNLNAFLTQMESIEELKGMPIKYAIEDDGKSFYKLTIKARPKIVADGLDDDKYDFSRVGKHLSAIDFHELADNGDTLVIDMRNHYESEIGKFKNAICPDSDTFRDSIKLVIDEFGNQKDRKILLYCTGGIRCEKASSVLIHHGFKDVSQLYGGIIEYAQQVKHLGLESKFIGKNFVFDERMGESIDGQVISNCHQCGNLCDKHTNCANDACHILFLQCNECASKYAGCCSKECQDLKYVQPESGFNLRVNKRPRYFKRKFTQV